MVGFCGSKFANPSILSGEELSVLLVDDDEFKSDEVKSLKGHGCAPLEFNCSANSLRGMPPHNRTFTRTDVDVDEESLAKFIFIYFD